MKAKNLITMVLAGAFSVSLLAGCGASKTTERSAASSAAQTETQSSTADTTAAESSEQAESNTEESAENTADKTNSETGKDTGCLLLCQRKYRACRKGSGRSSRSRSV